MECSKTDWQWSHVQPEVVEVVIVSHQKLPLRAPETHATEIRWAAKVTEMKESIRRIKDFLWFPHNMIGCSVKDREQIKGDKALATFLIGHISLI